MVRILLTAFDKYDCWTTNASWLALIEFTRNLPTVAEVTTRLYPVELNEMKEKLVNDLKANYDFVFHIGQAPKSSCIQLEEIAINVVSSGKTIEHSDAVGQVCSGGPDAYRCELVVQAYAQALRKAGIPAQVSFHAGTFLCNAMLYWSCRLADVLELSTKSMFIHVPLATSQVLELDEPLPFMASSMVGEALTLLVKLAVHEVSQPLG